MAESGREGSRRRDVPSLEAENEALRKLLSQNEQEIKQLKAQQIRTRQQLQLSSHRADQMLVKYNTLAGSKLGRLTLKIWDFRTKLHSLKVREGKLFLLKLLRKPSLWTEAVPSQKMSREQENWIESYIDRIAAIPDSNGCRYYERLPYRIGLICDEFFYESIRSAADFVFLTPENWEDALEQGLDAMLFVTAWRGLHEEWRGLGAVQNMDRNPMRRLAISILEECRKKNIPTVFYSKEDPPNYAVFLEYAKHCDHICTTARECVPRYREDCGHDRVQAVCFGIDPVSHNPIGSRTGKKEDTVLFSGSWMLKYPDRCRELSVMFDGILQSGHGLHIIDRNYPGNPKYCFPAQYFPYASGALPHDLLQKVHKLFDWAVNINSVKGSQTMFANRAFELQANGVLLLSNLSVGVNRLLPTVQMVQDSAEVARILNSMTEEERYRRQTAGIRSVMTGHTCFDRMAQILKPLGLPAEQPKRRILVLAEEITDAVCRSFARQSYPERELRRADTVRPEEVDAFDMIAWFAPDAEYGVFYLEDMANGFKYTACDYITRDAWLEGGVLHEGVEHDYVTRMGSKYRTLFWRAAFAPEWLLQISGQQYLPNGYSIDRFHYDAAPVQGEKKTQDYALSVILPVCDNGLHLYGKAFASLQRSSLFEKLDILLADTGSAEEKTLKMEAYLEETYGNVRRFSEERLEDLVSSVRAPYVVLLAPENEFVGDGCRRLLDAVTGEKVDLAAGSVLLSGADAQQLKFENADRLWKQKKAYVQAAVVRKELFPELLREKPERIGKACILEEPVLVCYE